MNRLPGFYTFGFIDGQTQIVFVPCLQDGVPAIVLVVLEWRGQPMHFGQ